MNDTDLAAEVAELRALVDRTVEWVTGLVGIARQEGYREGLAESDDYAATARAQQARAGFRVILGGRRAR
jgi:hypothetical protein